MKIALLEDAGSGHWSPLRRSESRTAKPGKHGGNWCCLRTSLAKRTAAAASASNLSMANTDSQATQRQIQPLIGDPTEESRDKQGKRCLGIALL